MIRNILKTLVLLVALSGLLMLAGSFFGGSTGIHFALIISLIMNGLALCYSDRIVLRMYHAQPLDTNHFGWIYDMVQELAHTMKLPMPKLWLVNKPMANAFATGRSPKHASVAVTTGIIDLLDRDELRGVLAHELSHIKNHDTLVTTIAATIATAIGYLAHMLRYAAFWGSMSNNRRRGNPFALLLTAILMPISATLIQLAISRSREYLADETGSKHSQDPLALASALEKLHLNIKHAHLHQADSQHASMASLFIVHPFTNNTMLSFFSTHPPMSKRIKRLRSLYEKMFS